MKKNSIILIAAVLLAIMTALNSSATVINVPGQYSTIQLGLNAASANDTILV